MSLTLDTVGKLLTERAVEMVPGQLAIDAGDAPAPVPAAPRPDRRAVRTGRTSTATRGRGVSVDLALAFLKRTRETENGHREWIGRPAKGGGRFQHKGTAYTAFQVAFMLWHGRAPVGNVRPSCDVPTCCSPAHVDDQETRQRDRAALADVKGMQHRPPKCEHDQAVHGRHRDDGRRYCAECNRLSSKPSCGHGNPTCHDSEVRPYACGPRCEEHQPARTRPYVIDAA
ncbi:hypothetical protein ACKI1I_03755 [Streptomyces turgidiscabies]|uniref:hypothetical protein n=1 Tax=Streptomyces turgidiscabies TaxID=85558 RepID=UPI0038F741EC